MKRKPVVLIIRDGWGENHNSDHNSFNAVKLARTPIADDLSRNWPRTEIMACGLDVGLPVGIMGNSEVGHQNIGAGRIVDQEIIRIDKAFSENGVKDNPMILKIFDTLKKNKGRLHLMGLCSDAGVHAMLEHLYGLLREAADKQMKEVFIHAFTDGRDTSPHSGMGFLQEVESQCNEIGVGRIASISGRFWAMDRDKRWARVEKAYNCLTGNGIERTARCAEEAVQYYYDNPLDTSRKGDEFIVPTAIVDDAGEPGGTVRGGDVILFFNFRGDRPRELTRAFIDDHFDGFSRDRKLDVLFVTMTEYEKGLCPNILFPKPPKMKGILGMYISEMGIPQFRCAETEKYPHVTFFFNDYRDEPFPGEDWAMIPSPQEVATYDQKPEMSAYGITEASEKAILSGKYGLVVINFANADMVGHTGSLEAAIKACEVVDECVGRLLKTIAQMDGKALITADHGNSDQMWEPAINGPHTAHTLNPVEVVVSGSGCEELKLKNSGRLADIAPTLLHLMELDQPAEMTGDCLILK